MLTPDQHLSAPDVGGLRVVLLQLLGGDLRVFDERQAGIDDLPHVVGRHVRRHAHRDARAPVHQQVGEPRGEDDGLLGGSVARPGVALPLALLAVP